MKKASEFLRKIQEIEAERRLLIEQGKIRLRPDQVGSPEPTSAALLKIRKLLQEPSK
jgi:hypothetical protein